MTLPELLLLLALLVASLVLALTIAIALLFWLAGSPAWVRRLEYGRQTEQPGARGTMAKAGLLG